METIARFIDFDFKYKWRSLIIDVLILQIIGGGLLYIGEVINTRKFFYPWLQFDFLTRPPDPIVVADFFLVLVLLFGLSKLVLEKIKNRKLLRDSTYEFKHYDWPSKWMFNGKTETSSRVDELFVKSSRAGCLLKTHLWQNFRMTFEMKFEKGLMQYVGIAFRAADLDNYFMVEIFRDYLGNSGGKDRWKSGIKPHVRYKGGWEINYREIHDELDFSNFTSMVLEVVNNIATLFYRDEPIFKWVLPTHVDVNHVESGFKEDDKEDKAHIFGKSTAGNVKEISFRLDYGMIGFRAHPGQGAIIKGLKVKPL